MLGRLWPLAVTLTLALAGCASSPAGEIPPQDDSGRYVVALTSLLMFDPAEARVPVGATVTWVNNASMSHDVAGYRGDPIEEDFAEFSSSDNPPNGFGRLMEPGEAFNHTFTQKGTWTIWCHTHHEERMKQILHVG